MAMRRGAAAAISSVGNRHGNDNGSYSSGPSDRGRGGGRGHHRGGGGGGPWHRGGITDGGANRGRRTNNNNNDSNTVAMGDSSRRDNRARVGAVDSSSAGDNDNDYANDDNDDANGFGNAAAPNTEPALRVLSFYEHGSHISFAFYSEDENEIVFEDATAHSGEGTERIVQSVLLETRPNLVLVGNKVVANTPLLECLTTMPIMVDGDSSATNGMHQLNDAARNSAGTATTSSSIPYQLLKSSAFEPRQCRSAILYKLRVLTLMRNHSSMEFPNDEFARGNEICTDSTTAAMGIGLHYSTTTSSSSSFHQPSNFHSLASIIDFDSSTLVRALGALIIYLRNTAFRLEEGFTVTVNSLRRCPASDSFLRLEESTLRALRIFATDRHPLATVTKAGGGASSHQRSKEGFSLFALLDRTKSKAGRERLRQWMAKPLRDIDLIHQRHVGIELFLHSECHPIASLLSDRMSAVGSMDSILLRMQRCCAQSNDFLVLGRMLDASYAIIVTLGGELRELAYKLDAESRGEYQQQSQQRKRDAIMMGNDQVQQEYPSVAYLDQVLQMCHVPTIRNLRERIASVVDEEATAEAKDHVVIHYGFHEELDRAKDTFQSLSETLSEVGRQVLSKHQDLISLKVVFLPQVGFLISIDKRQHSHDEATNTFPTVPEDFEFVFVQDHDAFFKSDEMNQLDEEIGDLDAFIKDTEALIVSDLEEEILECESELRTTFSMLADLDCILSLAGCAVDLNFVRPEICPAEVGVISIENGRHPLQELIVNDEFIPNDTLMDNNNRVMIVTGPNFSGKSCYARQVGILVYLTHIGSYLPCDSAKISIMDQIIVNFGDVETCSVPQSTFQRDLTQMAGIMRKSTPNSLVLIDEFGKGTAPTSGIAVMTSVIHHLAQIKCKVVCTTHFLEMFSLGLLQESNGGIKAVRMRIHAPESDEDDAIPLFKLEDGVACSSAGLVCARMAGLNKKVVDRASDIITALKEGTQVRPLSESMNANSPFQPNVRSAIRLFLAVDSWINATDEDLLLLQELVGRM